MALTVSLLELFGIQAKDVVEFVLNEKRDQSERCDAGEGAMMKDSLRVDF
jgi:hypothetical protein